MDDPAKTTLSDIVSRLSVSQLWAIGGALLGTLSAIFWAGYVVASAIEQIKMVDLKLDLTIDAKNNEYDRVQDQLDFFIENDGRSKESFEDRIAQLARARDIQDKLVLALTKLKGVE